MPTQEVQAFSQRWFARIAADALAQRVVAALWRCRDEHIAPILAHARADNPIIDPVILSEPELMARHVADHFEALLTLPVRRRRGRSPAPLDFVVAHGVRRAGAGVPLRAVLQAYRSGHKTFWAIMCREIDRMAASAAQGMRTTMLLSDYCIEYTDLISVVVTEAYVSEEARLADARTRLAIAVMDGLLRGHAPVHADGQAMCAASGLVEGQAMVVLVVRGTSGNSLADSAGAHGLAATLVRVLAASGCRALLEPRQDQLVAIVGGAPWPGTQVARALRDSRDAALRAGLQAVRVGIGLDVGAVADIPRSFDEAQLAVRVLGDGAPVAHLAELGIERYLHHLADATARRLLPPLPAEVHSGMLADTLAAFADANLNVKACARSLGVHTNTIYHRLNRIARISGHDPRSFHALRRLMTAIKIGTPAK